MARLILILFFFTLFGCIQVQVKRIPTTVDAYKPLPDVIQALQTQKPHLDQLSVGDFQPTDPNAKVNQASSRAGLFVASEGSFAKFLQNAMTNDLKEVGLFDGASKHRIDVTVLKNQIDAPVIGKGKVQIEIRLKVTRHSQIRLETTYQSDLDFDAPITGGSANIAAKQAYATAIQKLFKKIYLDNLFLEAIAR